MCSKVVQTISAISPIVQADFLSVPPNLTSKLPSVNINVTVPSVWYPIDQNPPTACGRKKGLHRLLAGSPRADSADLECFPHFLAPCTRPDRYVEFLCLAGSWFQIWTFGLRLNMFDIFWYHLTWLNLLAHICSSEWKPPKGKHHHPSMFLVESTGCWLWKRRINRIAS